MTRMILKLLNKIDEFNKEFADGHKPLKVKNFEEGTVVVACVNGYVAYHLDKFCEENNVDVTYREDEDNPEGDIIIMDF